LLEDDLAGLEFANRRAGSRQDAEIDNRLGHVAPQVCCNKVAMPFAIIAVP
jgi:hypothetical protein